MTVKWENVHVFISSTFSDMHAERDYLVKRVFPELQDWCDRRKLRLVDVDLRWGVTEEDTTKNKNVVDTCLRRIDDCRPFFVCLLGQRYGWRPARKDISDETFEAYPGVEDAVAAGGSVTEMEILHAIVSPFHADDEGDGDGDGYHPAEHTFFYLRDDGYYGDLPDDPPQLRRRIYTDRGEDDGAERRKRLQSLREELLPETGRPIHHYRATWDSTERTPEIALPPACPALLKENVESWQWKWQEALGLGEPVSGREIPAHLMADAEAYNERLTRGRLVDFRVDGQPLHEVVLADLKGAIAARYPEHGEVEEKDDLQRELDQHEAFLFTNSEGFIQRGDDFGELDDYVCGSSRQLFVLTAPGGMGKSMLLANWIDDCCEHPERFPNTTFHPRFVGQSDGSTTVPGLLRTLLRELQEVAGKIPPTTTETRAAPYGRKSEAEVPLEIPADPQELRSFWRQQLREIGKDGKTVIVIDALDQLETGLGDLAWLPTSALPKNVKLVVSFRRGEEEAQTLHETLARNENVWLTEVDPFDDEEDRRKLVEAYLSQYLKELDAEHVDQLIRARGARNPLFLKVVLSELRVFGAFQQLKDRIESDFGETPVSAFAAVLKRLEGDPAYTPVQPEDGVPFLFGLLLHARHGLSARELASLLVENLDLTDAQRQDAHEAVYLFLRQVRPFLGRREGRYDFFYESFEQAVSDRYVIEEMESALPSRPTTSWHGLLADYFGDQDLGPRKIDELPWQLMQARSWRRLSNLLADLSFFSAAWEASQYDVQTYWTQVEEHSPFRMTDAYRSLADAPWREIEPAWQVASLLYRAGHFQEALKLQERLADYYLQIQDPVNAVEILGNMAPILTAQGDVDRALEILKRQEHICRAVGHLDGLQRALGNQAIIFYQRGEYDRALDLQRKNERMFHQLGNRRGVAQSVSAQATILQAQGQLEAATELHKRHERLCRELGDRRGIAASLGNQGNILDTRGDLDGALALHKKQADILRQLGEREGLAASLGNQANVLYRRGELESAMGLHREEERLIRQLEHQGALADCLGNQALILAAQGHLDDAIALHREEERLYRQFDNLDGLSRTLGNQANILYDQGDLEGAVSLHSEEIRLCRELGNKDGLQAALGNLALILGAAGDLQQALELYREKARLCEEIGNLRSLAIALHNQAHTLSRMGRSEEALPVLFEQEGYCRVIGYWQGLADGLGLRARIRESLGESEGALTLLQQEARIRQKFGDKHGLQVSLRGRAEILADHGRLREAMKLFLIAENLCRETGDMEGLATCLANQAVLWANTGRPQQAEPLAREAYRLALECGSASLIQRLASIVEALR